MQPTGIIRRIDDLGRIVIPKDIRDRYHIKEGDPLEIFLSKEGIIFAPYLIDMQEQIKQNFDNIINSLDQLEHYGLKEKVMELRIRVNDALKKG